MGSAKDSEPIATRYRRAGQADKGRILDELHATTGWHRNHARKPNRRPARPGPSVTAPARSRRAPTLAFVTVPERPELDFLTFPEHAVREAGRRLPELDLEAMRLVLLLHRVTNALVYDLESRVHRPAGWSWSGFRLLFAVWISGPIDGKTAAALSGMSRAAVSNLVNTLERDGLVHRDPDPEDARAVQLRLTERGERALRDTFRDHNAREAAWAGALTPQERRMLVGLLGKLADAAQADWVNRRD